MKKKLLRLKLVGIILIATALSVVVSCRKDATWNSDWVVPLINDRLDLSKLVNDSTIEVQGGYYYLNLKRNLYDFSLTDIVSIPDTTIDRTTALNVSGLNVTPGFEFYNVVEEHELNLQDLELKLIQLSGGFIDFELSNPVQTGIYITIELPGVTKNGVALSRTFYINGGTQANPKVVSDQLDLNGYQIDLKGVNGDSFNKLRSLVKIKSAPGGEPVTVTNNHFFNVKAKFRDVKLRYARGYFGNRILEDTTSFNIDFFNNITSGTIDIQNASVKLILENGIKIDASGVIHFLKSVNKQNNEVSLSGNGIGNTFTIDQPTGSFENMQPASKVLHFTSNNSNIEQFFENLGARNEIAYKIKINPWGNVSGGWNEVYPQSRLRLAIEAQMPLSIQMDALTIRDTFAINLKQDKDKTHFGSGILQLDLDNAFPFAGKLKIIFLDEYFQEVTVINAQQTIVSSLFGTPDSQGIMHQKSNIELPLTKEVVEQLELIKHLVVEAVFDTPNPSAVTNQMVGIPADAYLGIKAKAKFKLNMHL